MNFYLQEHEDVWHRLKQEKRPIILYGTGDGADKILDSFEQYGIQATDLFVSDAFYRGQDFRGFHAKRYSDICEKYKDAVIVLCFAVFRPDMLQFVRGVAERFEVLAPEMPVFGNTVFTEEYLDKNYDRAETIYSALADSTSQDVFLSLLNYRLSGKIEYLFSAETSREEVFRNVLPLQDNEIYADLGAYRGDTIEEFLDITNGKFDSIYALEPDSKNYQKLEETIAGLSITEEQRSRIHTYPLASWSGKMVLPFDGGGGRSSSLNTGKRIAHTTDLDSLLNGARVTYVKMDVEGADKETLHGMEQTLKRWQPKLAIYAYHRTEDLFDIPEIIWDAVPDYRIYLRHHPYIPAWETNFYCK